MKLLDLHTDCLLEIFSYCSENDLMNLCRAHWLLNDVIEDYIYHKKTLDLLMCGHRSNPAITKRNPCKLSNADLIKIHGNWMQGCYKEDMLFFRKKMFASKLHLDWNCLYISSDCYLRKHERLKVKPLNRAIENELNSGNREDIGDFVKKSNTIFAGHNGGFCYIYEDGDYATRQQLHTPSDFLRCVDFAGSMYATATEKCAKIWRRETELELDYLELVCTVNEYYKTLRFNNTGDKLFGGLYTSTNRRALREIDVECGCDRILNSDVYSIYDLKLKDEHVLFTANFDASFRIYDRRSNRDELKWEDPFDSSFYCLEYDGLHGVLCGTKSYSRVNLYDIRVPNKFMQLYFPRTLSRNRKVFRSSPVYSMACDSRYLFVSTDHSLHILDYKVDCGKIKDYYHIFQKRNY